MTNVSSNSVSTSATPGSTSISTVSAMPTATHSQTENV